MQSFLGRLEKCNDCKRIKEDCEKILTFQPKASIRYRTYERLHGNIENLFIAEAPPSRDPRYFYNTEAKSGLRRSLLKQLNLNDGEEGLKQFSEKNFLVDTIKCRLKKENSQPPARIVANCAQRFLLEEIHTILDNTNGETKRIVLLGKTAKQGLEQFDDFKTLKKYKVTEDCGIKIPINDYTVIIYVFPNDMNKRATATHPLLDLLK